MKAAVITFPGSNCDRDLYDAFAKSGAEVVKVWHKETELPDGIDVIGVPLAITCAAARSPRARRSGRR